MYTTALGNPCEAEPGSPVERQKIPKWLGKRLLDVFGPTPTGSKDPYWLLTYWFQDHCGSEFWMDHYGTTLIDGQEVLVGEPYGSVDDDHSCLTSFAELLDCDLVVSATSYWYPGKTIRLALVPKAIPAVDRLDKSLTQLHPQSHLNEEQAQC